MRYFFNSSVLILQKSWRYKLRKIPVAQLQNTFKILVSWEINYQEKHLSNMEWWTEILLCTGWRNFLKCEFSLESHCKKLLEKTVLVRIFYVTRQLTLRENFADIEYEIGFALSIWLLLWLIEKFQELHIRLYFFFEIYLFTATLCFCFWNFGLSIPTTSTEKSPSLIQPIGIWGLNISCRTLC